MSKVSLGYQYCNPLDKHQDYMLLVLYHLLYKYWKDLNQAYILLFEFFLLHHKWLNKNSKLSNNRTGLQLKQLKLNTNIYHKDRTIHKYEHLTH